MFRAVASVVAVAMLAGCAGAPEGPIRNAGVPITSLALYDPARMAGDWRARRSRAAGKGATVGFMGLTP